MSNASFIKTLSTLAIAECNKRSKKVHPSVCIAQAALETGWGSSSLMTKANAYFGIKATQAWLNAGGKVYNSSTKEVYSGTTVSITAAFRAYDSLADSVADYYDLITGNSRYSGGVNASSAQACITAIHKGGYATDPDYVSKVMSIINANNLTQYDSCMSGSTASSGTGSTASSSTSTAKTHTVVSGDTLSAIAKKYGTTVNAIVSANKSTYSKITANYIQVGWKLNVSGGSSTSTAKTHTVVSGDTLSAIAKKYGTTVNAIVSANKSTYSKITANYIQVGWKLKV